MAKLEDTPAYRGARWAAPIGCRCCALFVLVLLAGIGLLVAVQPPPV